LKEATAPRKNTHPGYLSLLPVTSRGGLGCTCDVPCLTCSSPSHLSHKIFPSFSATLASPLHTTAASPLCSAPPPLLSLSHAARSRAKRFQFRQRNPPGNPQACHRLEPPFAASSARMEPPWFPCPLRWRPGAEAAPGRRHEPRRRRLFFDTDSHWLSARLCFLFVEPYDPNRLLPVSPRICSSSPVSETRGAALGSGSSI
jgi:hypothetical protein